jgi:hypothetical protein
MPFIRYFSFVGGALVLLLIGLSWCFPQPVTKPPGSATDGPTIRIASAEQLPERVVFDTSLPTIVPPPNVLEFSERWPQADFAEINPGPKPATPMQVGNVSKKQSFAKREPLKKVASQRAAPKANNEPAPNYSVQPPEPVTRMSLLDILKDRLGQTFFRLN